MTDVDMSGNGVIDSSDTVIKIRELCMHLWLSDLGAKVAQSVSNVCKM